MRSNQKADFSRIEKQIDRTKFIHSQNKSRTGTSKKGGVTKYPNRF